MLPPLQVRDGPLQKEVGGKCAVGHESVVRKSPSGWSPYEFMKHKHAFVLPIISEDYDGTGSWNPCWWKTMKSLFCMVNTMTADDTRRQSISSHYDMTVWILVGNDIIFIHSSGLIKATHAHHQVISCVMKESLCHRTYHSLLLPTLVQIMAWCQIANKALSDPLKA